MPFFPLSNFTSSVLKKTSKCIKEHDIEMFMTSPPEKPKPLINDLKDKKLISDIADDLIIESKIGNVDKGFFEMLAICSHSNKNILPTEKEVRNKLKKHKKNKKL